MKGNIALYEKNLTTYYLSYYICSNEICCSLNLDSLSNVVKPQVLRDCIAQCCRYVPK